MTNAPNQWKKTRKPVLIAIVSSNKKGCQHRNCGERRVSQLQFAHIASTPISRTGSRAVKEKFADIAAHPHDYRVECHRHHVSDHATVRHDRQMRRLGHR